MFKRDAEKEAPSAARPAEQPAKRQRTSASASASAPAPEPPVSNAAAPPPAAETVADTNEAHPSSASDAPGGRWWGGGEGSAGWHQTVAAAATNAGGDLPRCIVEVPTPPATLKDFPMMQPLQSLFFEGVAETAQEPVNQRRLVS